jgi:hypothetical protein
MIDHGENLGLRLSYHLWSAVVTAILVAIEISGWCIRLTRGKLQQQYDNYSD